MSMPHPPENMDRQQQKYTDGCEVAWFGCRRGAAVRWGGNSNKTLGQTRWTTSPEMASQAPEHKQWHSNVGLDEFVGHVLTFKSLVDSTQTRELGTVDKEQLKKMMGWGLFIEQVVGGLNTDSQRDSLARALGLSHRAILPRLYQARRWVLRSMLGSTFLVDHPRPESLVMWIMACYEELPPLQAHQDAGGETDQSASFVDDASAVVKSRGDVGVVSHAYSALLLCGGGSKLASSISTRDAAGGGGKSTRVPCLYEMSVDTAQKRAYASNCFTFLSSRCAQGDGQHKHGVLAEQVTSFILELSELAQTDIVSLEILCLVLLEPWRQATRTAKHQAEDSACDSQQESLGTSLNGALLKQVEGFLDDARLWSLDEWLLGEISHRHESFARAYVEKLTRSREELVRREYLTSADSSGLCLRKEDVQSRLGVLCSRSERLKRLVFRTIALN
ncbi:expressed unknown protein [Ectocarpus siliculosus]|uniref:Uncharacterized protein n=1 Tax=Ectocarpus siliculosus TaxID=2880 RepID=D7FVC5_ECTSI|nr:expressed unknown protein [Ectocarpus siliculosus]|eukprot:CBJ26297.1 expressed unknown protein [Ectocarpus siliculosus]